MGPFSASRRNCRGSQPCRFLRSPASYLLVVVISVDGGGLTKTGGLKVASQFDAPTKIEGGSWGQDVEAIIMLVRKAGSICGSGKEVKR